MKKQFFLTALASVGVGFLLAGCGGVDIFGRNSDIELTLTSTQANGLDLIVAPLEGTENDPTACTANSNGFGCSRTVTSSQLRYTFTTNALASSSPYHVYVRNLTNAPISETLVLRIDGSTQFTVTSNVPANSTFLAAKIFRNNGQQ